MGGFTKIPKLSVGDLGSEGTGDRIVLFDEEGDLVGWKPNADSGGGDFVPLRGTEVGKPITGDLELGADDYVKIIKEAGSDGGRKIEIGFLDDSGIYQSVKIENGININECFSYFNELGLQLNINLDGVVISKFVIDENGFRANKVMNKLNEPNDFAQLGDIATTNATLTPLSLSDLNTAYPTQPTGFKVICPDINAIYIKSSLITWDNLNTNQPVINNSYSTTEALTGGTWIDGKPIYTKVVQTNLSSLGRLEIDIEDVDFLFPVDGWVGYDTGKIMLSQSTFDNFDSSNRILVLENVTEGRTLDISGPASLIGSRPMTLILKYTKVDPNP